MRRVPSADGRQEALVAVPVDTVAVQGLAFKGLSECYNPPILTNKKEDNYKKGLLALLCFTVYLWSKTANIFRFRCIYAS